MYKLNFTIKELCESQVAKKYKIDNTPTIEICDNLLLLIINVLQPLRDKLDKPIIITSGYRCELLNKNREIKGAKNSQHLFGQAADIKVRGYTIPQLFDFIKNSGIEYDQLINEYDRWVHVSFSKTKNRKHNFKLS